MSVPSLSPKESFKKLQEDEMSFLIDVRTQAEWNFVGVPDLTSMGKALLCVEWMRLSPAQELNKDFCSTLEAQLFAVEKEKNKDEKSSSLYFICRSGQRSLKAAEAMQEAGWANCYNVSEGFEGNLDENKHRGTGSGWKAEGLPWVQS